MEISITVNGLSKLQAKLTSLSPHIADFTSELVTTGQYLQGWFETYPFVTEGAIYGESWAQLSPKYAIAKANKYRGKGILIASGAMQKAFSFQSSTNFLRVFNLTDYFKYHQLGTSKMPQRVVMALVPKNIEGIKEIFRQGTINKLNELI